jgi:rhodanese-related sulfurtransferase
MKKQMFMVAALGMCLGMGSTAWSYDAKLAESYANLFATVQGEDAEKALHFVSAEAFIKDIRMGKDVVAIDVRTPEETKVFTLTLPNSLIIPVASLFKEENLKRIPKDKPVTIVCKSGARATATGTALRHLGFSNVSILKGGFEALSSYFGAKQAYSALEAGK